VSQGTTEQLARELARRAEPVERLPSLRGVMVRVLAAASVSIALALAWKGLSPGFLQTGGTMWVFAALVTGLTLVGAGATVAALALGIPGREAASRAGFVSAGLGLVLALAWVPFLLALPSTSAHALWPSDLVCLLSACAVGVPPGVVALWFVAHSVPHRPSIAVLAAAAGAVGLGAIAAKASCPVDGLRHLVFGHALAPVGGGLLLAVPLLWLRRFLRRG
jgi:hypothetical protein